MGTTTVVGGKDHWLADEFSYWPKAHVSEIIELTI